MSLVFSLLCWRSPNDFSFLVELVTDEIGQGEVLGLDNWKGHHVLQDNFPLQA